ncbi:MAG: hypothetical protein MJ252_19255 [archaeon]|nr:hypothetical protein [archaeon]
MEKKLEEKEEEDPLKEETFWRKGSTVRSKTEIDLSSHEYDKDNPKKNKKLIPKTKEDLSEDSLNEDLNQKKPRRKKRTIGNEGTGRYHPNTDADNMRAKAIKNFLRFLCEIMKSITEFFLGKKAVFKKIVGTDFAKKYDRSDMWKEMISLSLRSIFTGEQINRKYTKKKVLRVTNEDIIAALEKNPHFDKRFFNSNFEDIYLNMFIEGKDPFDWPPDFDLALEKKRILKNVFTEEDDENYKTKFTAYAKNLINKFKADNHLRKNVICKK